eukprot:6681455-Pyramimonas_sp.AAC.1
MEPNVMFEAFQLEGCRRRSSLLRGARQDIFTEFGWYTLWSNGKKRALWHRKAWREHQRKTVRGR